MELSFFYIADGRLYEYAGNSSRELVSGVLESYLSKVRSQAQRNEWKHSGDGAKFRDAYDPGADAESRVAAVTSRVICAMRHGSDLIYSLAIDRVSGIYRRSPDSPTEGIVLSSGDASYLDFDIYNGSIALSSAIAGESHIAVMPLGSTACRTVTEGRTIDSAPVWSRHEPGKLYFCCAGLPLQTEEAPKPADYTEMVTAMFTSAPSAPARGPQSICLLDTVRGSLDELLADDAFDFLRPQSLPDGSLYYIKRPYSTDAGTKGLGCLADLFLLPVRLGRALFGFLNVFSAKYSGKTLSKTYGAKHRDAQKLFIDGNLINAEAELRANRDHGDKNPGIIPRSWELRRRSPDGTDTLIRRGAAAYRVMDDGSILVSNGSAILRLTDASEEKIAAVPKVTFIR